MKAEIEIIKPGLFSTIQDRGRKGYMCYGVPLSGAMDLYAAKAANLLVRNRGNTPVMEITQQGPRLRFSGATEIAVSGGFLSPEINGSLIENNRAYSIQAGDEVSFGRRLFGCRAYLAIKGGFKTAEELGSHSWYEGITAEHKLSKGMLLPYQAMQREDHEVHARLKIKTEYIHSLEVKAFPGPEFFLLSAREREKLESQLHIDRNNSRMGIQLQEELQNSLKPIITGPVIPGTVQLTPSGKLIVLMRDCQTTGGYPRILQVSEKGMDVLAQKIMGDEICFNITGPAELRE